MLAAETHPPARTLVVVRTGASVAELSNAALPRSIALNQILATSPVRVNNRNIRVAPQFPITPVGSYPTSARANCPCHRGAVRGILWYGGSGENAWAFDVTLCSLARGGCPGN